MMSPDRKRSVIPLFGQNTGHSFAPAKVRVAVARSGGPGRPLGWRVSASPLTAASTMAALRSLGTTVCTVAIFASPMLLSNAAHAEPALSATHRTSGSTIDPVAASITEASKRFAVPEHWIRAVMHVESGGKLQARSQKGAMGLMQIMPKTWVELRVRYSLGADPYDLNDNILAGTAYIRELHDRYGTPGFLAAYNAGPSRYEKHLATGRPLPDETRAYVAMLTPMIEGKQVGDKTSLAASAFTWASAPLFAVRAGNNLADDRPSHNVDPKRPSNRRAVVDLSALIPQRGNLFVRRSNEVRSQ